MNFGNLPSIKIIGTEGNITNNVIGSLFSMIALHFSNPIVWRIVRAPNEKADQ